MILADFRICVSVPSKVEARKVIRYHFLYLVWNLTFFAFTVDYKAIICGLKVCILMSADTDVNACIEKAVIFLIMKRIVIICLLLFYFLLFH